VLVHEEMNTFPGGEDPSCNWCLDIDLNAAEISSAKHAFLYAAIDCSSITSTGPQVPNIIGHSRVEWL
jgi:hypothetical protein